MGCRVTKPQGSQNLYFNWLMQEGDGTGQSKGDDKEANYLPVWFLSNVLVETPSQRLYQINSSTNHHCILRLMASKSRTQRAILKTNTFSCKKKIFLFLSSRLFCPTPDCTILRLTCRLPQCERAPSLNQQLAQKTTCCGSTLSRGVQVVGINLLHTSAMAGTRIWLRPNYLHSRAR